MWQEAEERGWRFYGNVSDCMAQCAAIFGGGIASYGVYRLIDLLAYTDKAVQIARAQAGEE